MGKKKKKSGNAAAAAEGATASSSSPAASSNPPALNNWPSNYDCMKIYPITRDPNLFLATDSLSRKVNEAAIKCGTLKDEKATSGSESGAATSSSRSSSTPSFDFAIYDSNADKIGRRAIALKPLKPGTLLLSECGQPWIAHAEHADKECHQCAKCIYDPRIDSIRAAAAANGSSSAGGAAASTAAGTTGAQKLPSRHIHCSVCESAFYCSIACQNAHRPQHELECPALAQAEEISDLALCNIDLIRAAIKYIVNVGREKQKMEKAEKEKETNPDSATQSSTTPAFNPQNFQSTIDDSDLLMAHTASTSPVDLAHMRDACSLILKFLPPEFSIESDRVAAFMCRLNNNCHALNLEEHPTIQFGFGLYPLCAIFNHSCLPNAIFVNVGAKLQFRVIREVEAWEELTVNYIGLYDPRTLRRQELWKTKKFFCQCRRCMLRPKNEEEKKKFAFDLHIGGIACQNPQPQPQPSSQSSTSSKKEKEPPLGKCTGTYRINYQELDKKTEEERRRKRREEKRKRKEEEVEKAGVAAANSDVGASAAAQPASSTGSDASSSASSAAPTPSIAAALGSSDDESDSDDDPPLALRPKISSCRCINCHHSAPRDQLASIQAEAIERSEELLSLYGSGTRTPAQLQTELQAFMKKYETLLDSNHVALFNILLPLVNVTGALRENKQKLEYVKRVIAMGEQCFPEHFLPLCNYYETLASTYKQLINKGAEDGVPRALINKYRTQAVVVLQKLVASLRICRGPDHILTRAAEHDLAEASGKKA